MWEIVKLMILYCWCRYTQNIYLILHTSFNIAIEVCFHAWCLQISAHDANYTDEIGFKCNKKQHTSKIPTLFFLLM